MSIQNIDQMPPIHLLFNLLVQQVLVEEWHILWLLIVMVWHLQEMTLLWLMEINKIYVTLIELISQ